VQVDEWLKKNKLPRLSLPVVCGYIPLVRFIAKKVMASEASENDVSIVNI